MSDQREPSAFALRGNGFFELYKFREFAERWQAHVPGTKVVPLYEGNPDERDRMLEQACVDLNNVHDELMKAQGVKPEDVRRYDWPEWSAPANTIRDAEKLLGKRLAKTNKWTLFPTNTGTP